MLDHFSKRKSLKYQRIRKRIVKYKQKYEANKVQIAQQTERIDVKKKLIKRLEKLLKPTKKAKGRSKRNKNRTNRKMRLL